MDTKKKEKRKLNPRATANPLSALTFFYMFPIFKNSYYNGLQESDLFEPLEEHKSSIIGEKLETVWRQEHRKHKKSALHRALMKCFGLEFVIIGILKLINEIMLVVVMPVSIGKLVHYFEVGQTRISQNDALAYAGAIVLCLILDLFIAHPCMMGLMHHAMKLRIACSSLIYRKTLRLSRTAMGKTTVGQLVNLLSNDVSKFDQGFILAHFLWIGPIQAAVGTYMLYREIGVSAFIGITFLIAFIPAQIWLGKRTSVLRLRTALRTDERVRLMNEIISGIQVIKMYTWEKPFAKLISFARRKEINAIRAHSYLIGLIYSLETFVTRTCVFISIIIFLFFGNEITAEKVFATTAIYNVLRPVITILFSISISSIAEVHISVKRVQKFLSLDELPVPAIEHQINGSAKHIEKNPDKISEIPEVIFEKKPEMNGFAKTSDLIPIKEPIVSLKEVYASWVEDSSDDTLKNVNLEITKGQLIAVIGPVGSGKSSLLNLLLKELPVSRGSLVINGSISFSCQEPWLFTASVRQNILFGADYDEPRYKQVVKVCALESDFAMFPFGDRTLVGEKGKSLSGGQKARINLARSIYKNADIYLLDDPLSAVDANVGKQLFDECITDFLNGKICILITHQLQYLKNADKILILKDGGVVGQGTYAELQNSGLDFAKLLEEYQAEEEDAEKKKMIRSRTNSEKEFNDVGEDQELAKETMGTGSITASVYWNYFRAGGGYFVIFLLAATFVCSQIAANAGDYFLTYWVNLEQDLNIKKDSDPMYANETISREAIVYTYTGITLTLVFFAVVHCIFYFIFFMRASIKLHDITFDKISQATMRFFNTNTSGRILNRFSKDLGIIDEYIPSVLFDVLEVGLLLVGTIVLSCIVDPWLLLPSIALMGLLYILRKIYLETSRSVKRIESITRSPLYGQMTASMQGLSTIRAFNAQEVLIKEFDAFQDQHSAAWFLFIASNRCFGFWLDVICIIFIGGVTFTLVMFSTTMYGGDIGLIITQYFGLLGSLQWGMRQWSELENQMTSVERVLEYMDVDTDPKRELKQILPAKWPEHGKLEFRNLSLKYSPELPNVLRNLNFIIYAGEKVGICGRTGAGKSSIITALFQLYETEGSILIDEVDICQIPLEELRSKISIIPQEPVLFSGSMRKNLDPFDEYDDVTLWRALELVELKDVIAEMSAGLNSNVSEGGSNFSVGQRQLVCLARAIIRKNKILVLDEATANVDPHTDALIQQTIRRQFNDCTVLTIAHRLHTVMDSNKILVMDGGMKVEFDHPHALLQNEKGYLYRMVDTTGRAAAKNLTGIAMKSYEDEKNK